MQSGWSGNRLRISGETKVVGHPFFYSNPSSSPLPFQPFTQLNVLSDSLLNGLKKKKNRGLADYSKVWVTQSCLTLCKPMVSSPPGLSVHGILQARILEWVAIPFSRGSSNPGTKLGSPALQTDSLPSEPPGKPSRFLSFLKFSCSGLHFKVSLRLGRASK